MSGPSTTKSIRERIEDGLREVGVLLVAFAPIDGGRARERAVPILRVLIFWFAGLILFATSLILERRRRGP